MLDVWNIYLHLALKKYGKSSIRSVHMGEGIDPRYVSHEKTFLLSIESWLVNRDPYNGLL